MGGAALSIFGKDFPTTDGTPVRDYIHVEDLGRAHILALQHLIAGGKSDFINLGTGKGNSVREIINSLKELDMAVNAIDAPRREGDPAFLVADATKANQLLNWKPKYMDIKETLKSAIVWHVKNG